MSKSAQEKGSAGEAALNSTPSLQQVSGRLENWMYETSRRWLEGIFVGVGAVRE